MSGACMADIAFYSILSLALGIGVGMIWGELRK